MHFTQPMSLKYPLWASSLAEPHRPSVATRWSMELSSTHMVVIWRRRTMDDNILTIGLFNLVFGVLALTIGYLYTLPRDQLPSEMSVPLALAIGDQ